MGPLIPLFKILTALLAIAAIKEPLVKIIQRMSLLFEQKRPTFELWPAILQRIQNRNTPELLYTLIKTSKEFWMSLKVYAIFKEYKVHSWQERLRTDLFQLDAIEPTMLNAILRQAVKESTTEPSICVKEQIDFVVGSPASLFQSVMRGAVSPIEYTDPKYLAVQGFDLCEVFDLFNVIHACSNTQEGIDLPVEKAIFVTKPIVHESLFSSGCFFLLTKKYVSERTAKYTVSLFECKDLMTNPDIPLVFRIAPVKEEAGTGIEILEEEMHPFGGGGGESTLPKAA